MKNRGLIAFLLIGITLILGSCGENPKKTAYYTVTKIQRVVYDKSEQLEGYRFWLRNHADGHPAYVFYPDERFAPGDQLIMQRTKKKVSFEIIK